MVQRPRTLAEQIADLDDPTPKDFDPEEDHESPDGDAEDSGSEDDIRTATGREHYVDVGKSKLRKPDDIPLGRQYVGARVSRDALLEREDESDEDDPFAARDKADEDVEASGNDESGESDVEMVSEAEGDEEDEDTDLAGGPKPAARTTNGGSIKAHGGSSDDEEEDDESEEDDDDGDDIGSDTSPSEASSTSPVKFSTNQRHALRKMMGESQKSVLASISQATRADAAKGRAVRQQRQTFDTLLNTRIRLQKALVAANTLSVATPPNDKHAEIEVDTPDIVTSYDAAEAAAFALWTQLNELRTSLTSSPPSKKRRLTFTPTTPLSTLWDQTSSLNASLLPSHRATLTRWALKTRTTTTLPSASRRLNPASSSTDQPLTSIIDAHLSATSLPRLIAQTRVPRSCAPVQASISKTSTTITTTFSLPSSEERVSVTDIYDDAPLYQSLLTTLISQRTADLSLPSASASNAILPSAASLPKLQKQHRLSTTKEKKASKGRLLRYDVHEKLQSFMAAETAGKGWWEEGRVRELFAGLVGGLGGRGLDERSEGSEEEDGEMTEGGLRLFG